jgi:c-di-GMP-binding flagellar brake protein YcgR
MYRAKLVAIETDGWRVTSPLRRNHYVPLKVGDRLTVEAPVTNGVYLFKTEVISISEEDHELTIAPPESGAVPLNRREEPRLEHPEIVRMDGAPAQLVNLSAHGARLRTHLRYQRGDRARLDLGGSIIYGWVLDVWPTKLGDAFQEEVRVRFEEAYVA